MIQCCLKINLFYFSQFAEIEVGTTAEATRCEAEFNNTTFRDRIIHVKSETGLGKSERKKFLEGIIIDQLSRDARKQVFGGSD